MFPSRLFKHLSLLVSSVAALVQSLISSAGQPAVPSSHPSSAWTQRYLPVYRLSCEPLSLKILQSFPASCGFQSPSCSLAPCPLGSTFWVLLAFLASTLAESLSSIYAHLLALPRRSLQSATLPLGRSSSPGASSLPCLHCGVCLSLQGSVSTSSRGVPSGSLHSCSALTKPAL